ncbi:MAG: hypothetical protein K2J15_02045, partial [Muribaculaceae bacterium]|nr:hypothetical protein [Muribaculaceae bacterium]
KLELNGKQSFDLIVYKASETVNIATPDYSSQYTDLDYIYLIGYMTEWMVPSEINSELYSQYRLEKVEPAVFKGTFYCPADPAVNPDSPEAQFRFMTKLLGWTSDTSLGSGEPDFNSVPVSFIGDTATSDIVERGLSNWCLPDWTTGGYVTMTVNLNTLQLTLKKETSGVESVETEEQTDVRWFDMTGNRVLNPVHGLYIKVSGTKANKVMVK